MTKILIADLKDGYTVAENLSIDDATFWYLMTGKSLADRFPETTIAVHSESPPTDYFDVGSMIVVSRRMKRLLQSLHANAEFFKLNVQWHKSDTARGEYYCCHILDHVRCLDYGRSQLTFCAKPGFTDRVDELRELAIDETAAACHILFRIANGLEYIVCVNDILANSLTDAGFTGCRCIAPEEWYFGVV